MQAVVKRYFIIVMALFDIPVNILLAGSSQCGKTTFAINLIEQADTLFRTKVDEVLYCTNSEHSIENILPKTIKICKNLPNISYFQDKKKRIVILDDLLMDIDKNLINFFTRYGHHLNFAIIFMTQNIFSQVKGFRDISLNCHIIVVFKNPRETQQIKHLSRQIYSKNPKFVQEAYENATERPYGYLLCDLRQSTPECLRFRTNIFKTELPYNVVYVPNEVSSANTLNNIVL